MGIGKSRSTKSTEGERTLKSVIKRVESDTVDFRTDPVQNKQRYAVMTSDYTPLAKIINRMLGDVWKVWYLRQLLGTNDVASPYDLERSDSSQQYELIKDFPIRVESGLNPSQNEETKGFTVSGSGSITSGVIPNYGDMFLADKGDGQFALLSITNSVATSDMKNTNYNIDYEIVGVVDDGSMKALMGHVVKTYVYDATALDYKNSAIVEEEVFEANVALDIRLHELEEYFRNRFWSRKTRSFTLPVKNYSVYDRWLLRYCMKIGLDDIEHPISLPAIGVLNDDSFITIWDVLYKYNASSIKLATRNFMLTDTVTTGGSHFMNSVRWSTYTQAVVPQDGIIAIDGMVTFTPSVTSVNFEWDDREYVPQEVDAELLASCNMSANKLFPLVSFHPYVLSTAFYDNNVSEMSLLEQLVYRMLNEQFVSNVLVNYLASKIYDEPLMSQMYYIPILTGLGYYSTRV